MAPPRDVGMTAVILYDAGADLSNLPEEAIVSVSHRFTPFMSQTRLQIGACIYNADQYDAILGEEVQELIELEASAMVSFISYARRS